MVDTFTPNFDLVLPEVGGSADTWGTKLNANFSELDSIVGLNRSAINTLENRTLTAGNGLTGGGNLSANRTISLGTPGTLDGSTTNSVTAASHTHAISSTDSRTSTSTASLLQAKAMNDHRTSGDHDGRYVNRAGDSMGGVLAFGIPDSTNRKVLELGYGYDVYVDTGAGAGSANNRLWFDAPNGGEVVIGPRWGSLSLHHLRVRGNVSLDGGFQYSGNGSGLTSLNASNISTGTVADARLPSTAVRTSRTITAGNGLSGGGDLAANRTITLGTPGSITATSSNSVTATSHTHAISEGTIRALISQGAAGAVGTYAFMRHSRSLWSQDIINTGDTVPGSQLSYTYTDPDEGDNARPEDGSAPTPSGTWRCMGRGRGSARSGTGTAGWLIAYTTLWLRIS